MYLCVVCDEGIIFRTIDVLLTYDNATIKQCASIAVGMRWVLMSGRVLSSL